MSIVNLARAFAVNLAVLVVTEPLANSPHGGEEATAARALLDRARGLTEAEARAEAAAADTVDEDDGDRALDQGVEDDVHDRRAHGDDAEAEDQADRGMGAAFAGRWTVIERVMQGHVRSFVSKGGARLRDRSSRLTEQ